LIDFKPSKYRKWGNDVSNSKKYSRNSSRSNLVWIVAGVLVVVFVGGILLTLFSLPEAQNKPEGNIEQSNTAERISLLTGEIDKLQSRLEEDTSNTGLLLALANSQYDLGAIYLFEMEQVTEGTDWFDRAVASYQKALQQEPENIEARVDMATAAFYTGQNELARAAYEQAIALAPTFAHARFNYAMFLFYSVGDYQGAIDQWEEVLKLDIDQDVREHSGHLLTHVKELMAEQSTSEAKK
jgi:tetratricopeptide (TPR) repeat protein